MSEFNPPLFEYDNIINLYLNKKNTIKELAQKYNVTTRTIHAIFKRKNIKCFNYRGKRSEGLNENFFEKIDSEEKAYFLGFIYADGHINSNTGYFQITLCKKDKEILEKFRNLLQLKCDLYYVKPDTRIYKGVLIKNNGSYRINFRNKKITNDLKNLGLHNNKSFDITFPDISEPFILPFIRGFFDGDGSISKSKDYKLYFLGPRVFLENINNYFIKNYNIGMNFYKINRFSKEMWLLQVGGNQKIFTIANIIYNNSNIYLSRKYNKFLELKKNKEEKQKKEIEWPIDKFTINNIINLRSDLSKNEIKWKIIKAIKEKKIKVINLIRINKTKTRIMQKV